MNKIIMKHNILLKIYLLFMLTTLQICSTLLSTSGLAALRPTLASLQYLGVSLTIPILITVFS